MKFVFAKIYPKSERILKLFYSGQYVVITQIPKPKPGWCIWCGFMFDRLLNAQIKTKNYYIQAYFTSKQIFYLRYNIHESTL